MQRKRKKRYKKIENFTDLVVWQEAHKLVLSVYQITKDFPKNEEYGLTSQIRRCVVSVTSNIAEGFSRKNKKGKMQFYFTAKESLTELHNQLIIAKDVGYLEEEKYDELVIQLNIVGKLLTGLIRSAERKK